MKVEEIIAANIHSPVDLIIALEKHVQNEREVAYEKGRVDGLAIGHTSVEELMNNIDEMKL
jgi:hypothetical protein